MSEAAARHAAASLQAAIERTGKARIVAVDPSRQGEVDGHRQDREDEPGCHRHHAVVDADRQQRDEAGGRHRQHDRHAARPPDALRRTAHQMERLVGVRGY